MALVGHMHWNIADWCNYRCSYCCEGRFNPNNGANRFASDELIGGALRFLAGLDRGWTVRLSAGEPSAHPRLFDLVQGVTAVGHRVAMETNLSLPLDHYRRFVELAGDRLAYLHASLHLEEAKPRDFLAKCVDLNGRIAAVPGAGFFAATVATLERKEERREAIELFERNGLKLHLQLLLDFMHTQSSEYKKEVLEPFQQHFEASAGAKQESPLGKSCFAGGKWLVLTMRGDVWRCHSGIGAPSDHLGNVKEGDVRLYQEPRPCSYTTCGCPGAPIV